MPPCVRESPFTTPRSFLNELCPLLCFGISGKKQNEKRCGFKQRKRSKGVNFFLKGYFYGREQGVWGIGGEGQIYGYVPQDGVPYFSLQHVIRFQLKTLWFEVGCAFQFLFISKLQVR